MVGAPRLLLLLLLFSALGRRVVESTKKALTIRGCDGPSCSNMGSFEIANMFDSLLTSSLQPATDKDGNSVSFEVGFKSCYNSCKRSINVACIQKGEMEGDLIAGMNGIEAVKKCFMKVNDEADVRRVVELIKKNYGVSDEQTENSGSQATSDDDKWGVSFIGQDVCGSRYNGE